MRSADSFFDDRTVRPIFFEIVPLMKPRIVWFCQPVALAISAIEHAVLFGAVLRFAKQKRRPSWKIERRLCRIVQSAQVSRCYAPNWIRDI